MSWNLLFVLLAISGVDSVQRFYPSFWGYFNTAGVYREPPRPPQTPLDIIVDITNDLGVAVLQDHSNSRANFAFSPYGVASVLVILFEGARGESAWQIHRALRFPSDKELMRIGFRDLHRHLKSYFNHEGFLSGITLNKEGSSLKFDYKKILKYYGYDIDLSSFLENGVKETDASSSSILPNLEANMTTTTVSNTMEAETNVSTTTEFTTTEAQKTTNSETDTIETTVPNITESLKQNGTETEVTTVPQGVITEISTANETTETYPAVSDKMNETATEAIITTENKVEEVTGNNEQKETTTVGESTVSLGPATNSTVVEVTTISGSGLDNGMLIPQPEDLLPKPENESVEETNGTKITTTTVSSATITTEVTKPSRSKRKVQDLKESTKMVQILLRKKEVAAGDVNLQFRNGMYDAHVFRHSDHSRGLPRLLFLLDGIIETPVPMMTFTTVFPFGYIHELHAKALEFPLDVSISSRMKLDLIDCKLSRPLPTVTCQWTNTDCVCPLKMPLAVVKSEKSGMSSSNQDVRYKLLILLPMESKGMRRLIYDLSNVSIREVVKSLRPTRVKTTVPTFMVEGFVVLTSSLQKLGITDVFDPYRSNLSGMSSEPELFVRNIEQSVTVVIKNYVEVLDIETRYSGRNIEEEFEAVYPFLYFVLDSATNVALMAGQMVNPLISRMY